MTKVPEPDFTRWAQDEFGMDRLVAEFVNEMLVEQVPVPMGGQPEPPWKSVGRAMVRQDILDAMRKVTENTSYEIHQCAVTSRYVMDAKMSGSDHVDCLTCGAHIPIDAAMRAIGASRG